jgi:uncharacterized lipoprotein YddW (UPF0748 family)
MKNHRHRRAAGAKPSRARHQLLACIALLLTVGASRPLPARPGTGEPIEKEVRALWVTRWDYKTEDDVRRVVRWSAALGLNRLFFQVRGRADAFYRSKLEPWGEELGGKDPGFDPLQTAILEARKAGVELHAWMNVLPAWKGKSLPRNSRHVFYQHPEWLVEDSLGNRPKASDADYVILNPCLPEVRRYLAEVVTDIVGRYDVHGIHLDYIRFGGPGKGKRADFPFDARTLGLFRKYSGGTPTTAPAEWDRWRTLSVDTLLYRLSRAAREARADCLVTAAVLPDYASARRLYFQDAVKWQKQGWVDQVYPMTYAKNSTDFSYSASRAMHSGVPEKVIPGIGLHWHSTAVETARQIEVARALGASGYCLFSFSQIFPSPSHESGKDVPSRNLRAALRATLLVLNGGKAEPSRSPPSVSTALDSRRSRQGR